MEFKGTKGKWEQITANWDLDQEVFVEDTEIIVAKVFGKPHEQRYNALLISKAPEMLEILELILETEGLSQKVHSNLIFNAKRIIKEATTLNTNENGI